MDYILEELLRQRRALALLMTGGQTEEETQTPGTREGTGGAWEARLARGIGSAAAWTRSSGEELAETEGFPAEESAELWTRDGGAALARTLERLSELRETAAREGGALSGTAFTAAGTDEYALPTAESAAVTAVETSYGAGGVDPAALSRTFQRDARRYDGGFGSLY